MTHLAATNVYLGVRNNAIRASIVPVLPARVTSPRAPRLPPRFPRQSLHSVIRTHTFSSSSSSFDLSERDEDPVAKTLIKTYTSVRLFALAFWDLIIRPWRIFRETEAYKVGKLRRDLKYAADKVLAMQNCGHSRDASLALVSLFLISPHPHLLRCTFSAETRGCPRPGHVPPVPSEGS